MPALLLLIFTVLFSPSANAAQELPLLIDTLARSEATQPAGFFIRQDTPGRKIPIVLYHGWGANSPDSYRELINHIIKRKFAVVFPLYGNASGLCSPENAYRQLCISTKQLLTKYGDCIDTRKIGFIGHSFGGGLTIRLAHESYTQSNYGKTSLFVWLLAPWYCTNSRNHEYETFPSHGNVVLEVFENDRINDPRIALEAYRALPLGPDKKEFVILKNAYHDAPNGSKEPGGKFSPNDSAGIQGVFDKLSEHTFSEEGALSTGIFDKTIFDDTCIACFPILPYSGDTSIDQFEHPYVNFFEHAMNPRTELAKKIGQPLALVFNTPNTIKGYVALLMENNKHIQSPGSVRLNVLSIPLFTKKSSK